MSPPDPPPMRPAIEVTAYRPRVGCRRIQAQWVVVLDPDADMDAKHDASLAPLLPPNMAVVPARDAAAIPTILCRTSAMEPVVPAPSVVGAFLFLSLLDRAKGLQ